LSRGKERGIEAELGIFRSTLPELRAGEAEGTEIRAISRMHAKQEPELKDADRGGEKMSSMNQLRGFLNPIRRFSNSDTANTADH
jgi:hypothetical protein